MENQKEINKILQNHEQRISALENKGVFKKALGVESWYRPGSTIDKIIALIKEGFLKDPKSLKEIILRLEEKDYHLKASDLTLPLRKMVRKGLLRKTKQLPGGVVSRKWLYVKA
ncbi:MAG: hypothetical protein WC514_01105 [Candidatus Paceibacterota bacterium]